MTGRQGLWAWSCRVENTCRQSLEAVTAWHVWGRAPWHHGGSSGCPWEGRVDCGGLQGCMEEFVFFALSIGELLEGFEAGMMGS